MRLGPLLAFKLNNMKQSIFKTLLLIASLMVFTQQVAKAQKANKTVEYEGGLFAQNMDLILLNEKNELVAWQNTKKIIDELMMRSFEYSIHSSPPTLVNNTKYQIGIEIDISMNKNYQLATDILLKFCESITLSEKGVQEYAKVTKPIYPVLFPLKQISMWTFLSFQQEKTIIKPSFKSKEFVFRNRLVANEILHLPWDFAKRAVYGFKLSNGLDNLSMSEYTTKGNVFVSMAPYMKPNVFRGYIWKIPRDDIWVVPPRPSGTPPKREGNEQPNRSFDKLRMANTKMIPLHGRGMGTLYRPKSSCTRTISPSSEG